jgi:protein-S-isoprenylcysteine O-methyltransferase Ste14
MRLALQTLRTAVIGLIVFGLVLFIPAGTLAYWPGWAFIVVFTIMTNAIGLYLAIRDPAALERRVKFGATKETRPMQRVLIAVVTVVLFAVLVVSALDWRFGWSNVPLWVIVLGDVLVAGGLYVCLLVMQQNSFAASTIETMEGQRVISTGVYGIVRHPMYLGTLVMSVGIPLALGSYWGLLFILAVVPVLALRIGDEEEMLANELDGYANYRTKVRSRLIPGVW